MVWDTIEHGLVALGHGLAFAALAVITWMLYVGVLTGDWTFTFTLNGVGEGMFEALLCTLGLFGLGLGWGRGNLQT